MTEIVKINYQPYSPIGSFKQAQALIAKGTAEMLKILPAKQLDRIGRMYLNCLQANNELLECTQHSFMLFLLKCAETGLEPGAARGLVYPVPFNQKHKENGRDVFAKEVNFIIGYRGYMKLAIDSGKVSHFYPCMTIHQNDEWTWREGLRPELEHYPSKAYVDRGNPIAYYSRCKLTNGEPHFCLLFLEEVKKHQAASKAQSGPWKDWFEEMAWKTCIRVQRKTLPDMPELSYAMALDDDRAEGTGGSILDMEIPLLSSEPTVEIPQTLKDKLAAAKRPAPPTVPVGEPEPKAEAVRVKESPVVEQAEAEAEPPEPAKPPFSLTDPGSWLTIDDARAGCMAIYHSLKLAHRTTALADAEVEFIKDVDKIDDLKRLCHVGMKFLDHYDS